MPVHLVFFEDLRNDVGGCMRSIIKFMNLDIPNVDQVPKIFTELFSSICAFSDLPACWKIRKETFTVKSIHLISTHGQFLQT